MVIVDFFGIQATIKNGKWSCENKYLERTLNANAEDINDSPSDPDPEYTHAINMAKKFNGKVLTPPKKSPNTPDGVVV